MGSPPAPAPQPKAAAGLVKPIAIIVATVLVFALAAAGIWWFLSRDDGSSASNASNASYDAAAATSEDEDTPIQTAVAVTETVRPEPIINKEMPDNPLGDANRSSGQSHQNGTAPAPKKSYSSGLTRSGWTSKVGAQSNSTDTWVYAADGPDALLVICENPDNGRYYYRGVYDGGDFEADVDMSTADVQAGYFVIPAKPNTIYIEDGSIRITDGSGRTIDTRDFFPDYSQ